MKYLILENGMIVESDKTATMKDSVPFFDIDSSSFERIRIISEANTLSIAKQRLIEYCSDKPKELSEFSNRDPYPYTRRLTKAPQSWQYVEVEE